MLISSRDRVKECAACGNKNFPRISPAVMVLVQRSGELLLARGPNFPAGFFSLVAGFVEPGETLETCVHREIKEEIGITVTNIRYFGSQPWPFPDSLMISFIADYAGGEIQVDGQEIIEAAWYRPDDLPQIPGVVSLAGKMILWFIRGGSQVSA
jgi:NAD+ diphosphatase